MGVKHVLDWKKIRWLAPTPKDPLAPAVDELRPIMLLEVLRKCWMGMIVKRIMNVIEEHGVLSESQHAFRRGRGTYTANLQPDGNGLAATDEAVRLFLGYARR